MNQLCGCCIVPQDEEKCRSILRWMKNREHVEGLDKDFKWALAHCTDGVTWGVCSDRTWQMSSDDFSDLCPEVTEDNLIELRIFGRSAEILIWRNEGTMAGRMLRDSDIEDPNSPLKPADEIRIVLGDRLLGKPRGGFSRVGTARGLEQAVPLQCSEDDFREGCWPLRLKVRHYFERDEKTGVVRVAVSRLVELYKEKNNGA